MWYDGEVKDKFNLPRKHFSWSQLSLWNKSREQYRARYYVPDAPQLETRETLYGKKIAGLLERREFDEHPVLRGVVEGFEISEHPLECVVGGVTVVAYLDLFNKQAKKIREIKTGHANKVGVAPWNKVKVMGHDQLVMYSMLVKEAEGAVDPWLDLVWLETEFEKREVDFDGHKLVADGGSLRLTGRVETFERRVAQWEHKRIKDMVARAVEEISEDYSYWKRSV